jgi:RNA polymerase primary sigma factor
MTRSEDSLHSNEQLNTLFIKAELQGYLTLEDLLEIDITDLEEIETQADMIEMLHELGIVIIEQSEITSGSQEKGQGRIQEDSFQTNLENISSDDTVSMYLKEMSAVPLLSVEEEIDLAQRIEKASLARREIAEGNGRANSDKRRELELLVRDGFFAREYLIKANTRLVVSIARRYLGRGVPFLDLIQEGNMGLMRAVEKYEYQRGFRFSTYATWWIRQSITRAIAYQGRTIRVPVHMFDRLRELYKVSQEMEQALGRNPTAQELADTMDVDIRKVRWMQQVAQIPISLESPMNEEGSEVGSVVVDRTVPSPVQMTYQSMLRERVEEVLSTLTPREARVLRLRFGLGQERAYTLEEVGRKFGLTRERIRQIEGKALRRLRHPQRAGLLRDYI